MSGKNPIKQSIWLENHKAYYAAGYRIEGSETRQGLSVAGQQEDFLIRCAAILAEDILQGDFSGRTRCDSE